MRWAEETGAAVLHDFAYADLMFDGLAPTSFLTEPGAKEVGAELFSMSKSYGMAGWRLGFVVGNAELVERVNLLQDHVRAGVFRPIQAAGVAALTGPQDSVEERRAIYERRRDQVTSLLPDTRSDSTFYVWWRLPEGLGAERILEETAGRRRPGRGVRAERVRLGAHLAGHAGRPPRRGPRAPRDRSRPLAVPVDDPAARQVVRGELHLDPVAGEDLDPVAAHLAGRVAQHVLAGVEAHLEHPVREGLGDLALQLELFFLCGYRVTSFRAGE